MSSVAKGYLLAKWGGDPLGGSTGLGLELAVKGEGEAHLYLNSHIRMWLDRERQEYQGRLAEIWGKHQQVEYTWLSICWYLVRLLMGRWNFILYSPTPVKQLACLCHFSLTAPLVEIIIVLQIRELRSREVWAGLSEELGKAMAPSSTAFFLPFFSISPSAFQVSTSPSHSSPVHFKARIYLLVRLYVVQVIIWLTKGRHQKLCWGERFCLMSEPPLVPMPSPPALYHYGKKH